MAETQGKQQGKKSIARNRSARHEYEIGETFECGLVLTGTEVKSLRERGCQLTDTFCLIRDGEAWIHGMHLHPYTNGGVWNVDPDRKRKLLLHRRQIDYLDGKLRQKGLALVPLEIYFDEHNRVKLRFRRVKNSTTSVRLQLSVILTARFSELSRSAAATRSASLAEAARAWSTLNFSPKNFVRIL